MNDQNENLVRQSKWSGRRIVLFYWFAIVFLGTSAAAGLGTSVFKPVFKIEADPHADIEEPWHADDCIACHADEVAGWETTWHNQIVGEFDPSDIAKNGSKVSFNSTHYWRTPNTPANESDLTNMSNINYWTYDELYNASGQQCCMTTRWYNVTGDPTNPAYENYTNNIWDIGVSCAACHRNPGSISLSWTSCSPCHMASNSKIPGYRGSAHYGSLNSLLAPYGTLDDLLASGDMFSLKGEGMWSYVGQSTYLDMTDLDVTDYSVITCVTCHDPHDSTVNAGEESNPEFGMSPWTNPYTGEKFGPSGHQLRTATTNDLCGTCHDISLNTSTGLFLDPTDHEALLCTDCHGYTFTPATYDENMTITKNSSISNLNHNWKFAFDATTGCGVCHNATTTMNATTAFAAMQTYLNSFGNLTDMNALYDAKLVNATATWNTANATVGVDMDKLDNADSLIDEAKDLAKGTKYAFHNPELGLAADEQQLALALTKLDAAIVEATDALPEPVEPTTTTVPVTTTTEEPTTTTTTTSPAPAIGLLAVMSILGVVALFRRKRR